VETIHALDPPDVLESTESRIIAALHIPPVLFTVGGLHGYRSGREACCGCMNGWWVPFPSLAGMVVALAGLESPALKGLSS